MDLIMSVAFIAFFIAIFLILIAWFLFFYETYKDNKH